MQTSPNPTPTYTPSQQREMFQPRRIMPLDNLRAYLYASRVITPQSFKGRPFISVTRHHRITPPDQFLLTVEPDSRFRLRRISMLIKDEVDRDIQNFMDRYVSSEPRVDVPNPGTNIRIPEFKIRAPGFDINTEPVFSVNNTMTLAKNTLQMLETSERILNIVWPHYSQGHTFMIPTESHVIPEADADICVPIFYTKVREQDLMNSDEPPMVKMVVLVVPPWAIAGSDLCEIESMREFPEFKLNDNGTLPTFTRAQKLVAQAYDCCKAKNCPFFVITTSVNWIFGAFSRASGWSSLIISHNIYADFQPTILEWVTYWAASALKVDGSFSPDPPPPPYPVSGNPELQRNVHNLQETADNDPPSRDLSDEEWCKTILDRILQEKDVHTTTQPAEDGWIPEIEMY